MRSFTLGLAALAALAFALPATTVRADEKVIIKKDNGKYHRHHHHHHKVVVIKHRDHDHDHDHHN